MRWTALVFLLPVLHPFSAKTQTTPRPNTYVGSEACKTCHADVWLNFYRNPHDRPIPADSAASFKGATAAPVQNASTKIGCEGCHGPGGDHVAAHGGKATIRAFSTLPSNEKNETCLTCHAKDVSRANFHSSAHAEAGLACTDCHSIHKSATPTALLAKRQTELCYSCHPAERAQFELPSKHRVNEGVIECSDCHNPHGSVPTTSRMGLTSAMLRPAFDNEEPCLKCHVDKRGPFVFEHPSVRVEGCEACHTPHGSTNAKLLRRPVEFTLCLECHNGAGTFGRENRGVFQTPATHNLLDPKYQHCTLCHVRIHGSNSDPAFLR